ncbi:MAG TPA: hypothetical protein DCP31_33995 [Cyanobacteria bacterium UBA8543]|nr:hypothetical protein [Cyanobacteria bacterium UBA8543]
MNPPVIICVDDEITVLDSLRRELSEALEDSFEIETAVGGIEALDLLEDLLAEGCDIAVVIVDYIMPDIKGDEVLKRIHQSSPKTLKIMLTGQATLEGVTNAVNFAQLYRYIPKPWQVEQLNLTVQEALKIYELEQKLAEQNAQITASERRFNQFLEAMPIGVSVHDATGALTYANCKAKALLGIEVLAEATTEQLSPAYGVYRTGTGKLYPTEELPIVRSLSGETVRADDLELHQPDKIIPVEVSTTPILDETGKIAYAIAAFQDITERKQAERDRLRLAQEQEAKNVALRMNQEIEAKNQELATALHQLKATQRQLIESEKMATLGQLIASIAHEINTPLGAIQSSVVNISTELDETLEQLPTLFQSLSSEQQQYFLALFKRTLQQKSTFSTKEERQFKRAIKRYLESLEINHADLIAENLVIMGIYNEIDVFLPLFKRPDSLHLLEAIYKLSGLKRSTTIIQTATDRASKVVFALKSYAHYDQPGPMTQANLIAGIETVLTLYDNQLKHHVEIIRNYAELPLVLCYPDELNQVWTNLVHNALQAMDYRGTLTIEAQSINQHIKISITDSGTGIPKEIQEKIFKPFFTTKRLGEGSGLGLDIVKKILEKHSGSITVDSQPGQTTFNVFLPIQPI